LPLDDCLYALQPTIPHLTRSSLHRCLRDCRGVLPRRVNLRTRSSFRRPRMVAAVSYRVTDCCYSRLLTASHRLCYVPVIAS
jgi:hypothetical protein